MADMSETREARDIGRVCGALGENDAGHTTHCIRAYPCDTHGEHPDVIRLRDEIARLRRETGEPVEDAELLHVVGQYIRAHLHMDSDEPNPLLVALRFGDLHDAYNVRVHGATPPAPASERTLDFTAHAERLKKAIEGFAGYSATHHNVGANLIAEASFVVGLLEGMTGMAAPAGGEREERGLERAAHMVGAIRSWAQARNEGWVEDRANESVKEIADFLRAPESTSGRVVAKVVGWEKLKPRPSDGQPDLEDDDPAGSPTPEPEDER